MTDDNKKSAKDILPNDQKGALNDMPDHMESPLNEIDDIKTTIKEGLNKAKNK